MATLTWYQPAKEDVAHLEWLARTTEDVIEPELPIIDPHHHLWDAVAPLSTTMQPYIDEDGGEATGGRHVASDGRPGGGVDAAAAGWQKRYTTHDIAAELIGCGHNIEATVFIECGTMFNGDLDTLSEMRCVGETAYVNGVAAQAASGAYGPTKFCAGIVATCDMALEPATVERVLDAHAAASQNFRGIRAPYVLQGAAGHGHFAANMALLEAKGLVYDLGASCASMHEAVEIAKAYPNVTMVLNHCGECAGPSSFTDKPEVEAAWRQGIVTLGSLPNVYAKVGGCTMTYNGWDFEKRDTPVGSEELATLLSPIYSHVIKSFTPAKAMFESNFPVDKVCLSYQVVWNAYKRVAAAMELSDEDKAFIFHDTAAKVYGLAA